MPTPPSPTAAADAAVTDRLRTLLADHPNVEEKRMFGGLAFMINDKLCICSGKGRLLCRVNPSDAEQLQDETSVTAMIMNGREMRGYLIVPYENVTTKLRLQKWLKRCLAFNAQLMGTGN